MPDHTSQREDIGAILDTVLGRTYSDAGPAAYARPFAFFTPSNTTLLSPPPRFWEVTSISGGAVVEIGVLDPDGTTPQTIAFPAVYVGQKICYRTFYLRAATTATVIAGY